MSISKSPESLIRHLSAQSTDPEEALRLLLNGLRPELDCDWIGVFVGGAPAQDTQFQSLAEAGRRLEFPGVGNGDDVHRDIFTLAGPYERIRQDVHALDAPTPVEKAIQGAGMRSYAALPLVSAGQIVGSIQALSRAPNHFDVKRLARLRTQANQLAVVALHVLFMRRHVRQTHFLSLSQALIEELGSVPRVRDACEHVARRLVDLLEADRVSVYLSDPDDRWLTCEASFEGGARMLEGSTLLPSLRIENTPYLSRALSGSPILVTPSDRWRLPEAVLSHIRLDEAGTLLVVPLAQGGETLGLVLCQKNTPAGTLFEDDLSSVRLLGQQIGLIVHSRRVVENQERSLKNFAGLLGISHALTSTSDLSQIPAVIGAKAQSLTEADTATVFLLQPDGVTLAPAICLGQYADQIKDMRMRVGEGITGTAAATRRGEVVNLADEDPRTVQIPGVPKEHEAILAVPLVSTDHLLGVLTLHKWKGRTFEEVDLNTVEIFAGQAAIAIENVRLFSGLRAERNRLVTMLQRMREAVIFAGSDGTVLLVNEAARVTLGLGEPEKVMGRPLLDLLDHGDLGGIREAVHRVRRGQEMNATIELGIQNQTYVCSVSAVRGGQSEPHGGEVVLLQNITALKEFEAQLAQSSKMSAVGQLAAGVAHEFNNLIAGIYGYAQLMRENPDPAVVSKGIDVIFRSSERARELTASLLTFSRRRAGRRELVDLGQILNDTLLLLNRQMEKSGIHVERQLGSLPATVCDAGKFQQVFLNLLINAQQAMEKGGTLTITSRAYDEQIEFAVTDTGCGIPEEHLTRIFEPFFTTKGPLAGGKAPGTGLGLSTAYNVVRDHGGNITVTSKVGEGATFVVTIPVESVRAVVESPGPAKPAAKGTLSGRILVGEDDATLCQLICQVLTEQGHQVETVADQKQLLARLREGTPDLVVVDQLFPGEDLLATLELMRRGHAELPILLVSGKTGGARINSEGDAWLFRINKPFRNRDMVTLVSRILTQTLRKAS